MCVHMWKNYENAQWAECGFRRVRAAMMRGGWEPVRRSRRVFDNDFGPTMGAPELRMILIFVSYSFVLQVSVRINERIVCGVCVRTRRPYVRPTQWWPIRRARGGRPGDSRPSDDRVSGRQTLLRPSPSAAGRSTKETTTVSRSRSPTTPGRHPTDEWDNGPCVYDNNCLLVARCGDDVVADYGGGHRGKFAGGWQWAAVNY